MHIFIIGYFEQIFDFVYETCNNSHMYVFLFEYLEPYTILIYSFIPHIN